MSNINQGLQFITFDFKHKAKGYDFNRLNREVLKPGVYKGMSLSFTANDLIISSGNVLINGTFQFDPNTLLDNILVKIDFETSYTYVNFSPSRQQAPSVFYDELVYLHYEYDEVIENYAEFRKISVFDINSLSKNDLIVGSVSFDSNAEINGISYSYREYGSFTYETDYGKVETDWNFNKSYPDLVTTKKWRIDSANLQTGKHVLFLPDTTPISNGSEKEYDLVLTNTQNTALIKNNLNVNGTTNIFGTTNVTGTTNLTNVNVSDRLTVNKFYGRVPLGSVIPVIGVFQLTGNGGTFTAASTPASGIITDDGFQRCDGSLINNASSIFNGRFTPNISDSRFIQGSTSAGGLGGNTNNNITISSSNLPTHTHNISHTHTGGTTNQSATTTGNDSPDHYHEIRTFFSAGTQSGNTLTLGFSNTTVASLASTIDLAAVGRTSNRHQHNYSHTHDISTTTQSTNTSGDGGFANTAIDIRPKYINAVYLIRVL